MENFPIDPQQIIFIVVFLLSAISGLFGKKGKDKTGFPREKKAPERPRRQESASDPLGEFKRMIEEAQQEAQAQRPPVFTAPSQPAIPPPPVAQKKQYTPAPAPVTFQPKDLNAPPPKAGEFPSNRKVRKKAQTGGDLSLQALLKSPNAARQAVILTEVLGKPKGAQ